jgi:Mg2+ and Co2+ transporter CorA
LTKSCETRFVNKHKSIRKFKDQYVTIVDGLEEISKSNHFNSKTRQLCYEMLTAITKPFVVILSIMAKYSAKFENVSKLFQGIYAYLQEATKHIQNLLSMLEIYRNNCVQYNI